MQSPAHRPREPFPLPASLRQRLLGWQRDLRAILDGLGGRHPSPLVAVGKRPPSGRGATIKPRQLEVVEVRRETAAAVTLVLVDRSGAPFAFEAGQFLTLLVAIPGRDGKLSAPLRRAYSACSSPLDGRTLAITCKRVAGGQVSNYLNDAARPGMLLEALGPSGSFTPRPRPERQRHLILIGGGSGITPLLSILETVLQVERGSRVSLVYGNQRQEDIIFSSRLAELTSSEPERLTVRQVLSEPPPDWQGGSGLLDDAVLEAELAGLPVTPDLPTEYYLCGPEPMMAAARALLRRAAVSPAAIHEERFASLRSPTEAASPVAQPLQLTVAGARRPVVNIAPGATLLEAGVAAGVELPFSCTLGGCGACKGRLLSGEVVMQEPNCLTADEREGGYILCCIARPRGPVEVAIEPSRAGS